MEVGRMPQIAGGVHTLNTLLSNGQSIHCLPLISWLGSRLLISYLLGSYTEYLKQL